MIIRPVIIRKIALLHKKIFTDVFLQIIIIINSSGTIRTVKRGDVTGNTFEGLLYAQLDQPPKVRFEINAREFFSLLSI